MEFNQLDRIIEIKKNSHIICSCKLDGTEPYLKDHFPHFQVMPGVLMLESLRQAAGWLMRASNKFQFPITEVREVKNFKFQDFVQPGMELISRVDYVKVDGNLATFKAIATVEGRVAVTGRLVLEAFSMKDRNPVRGYLDDASRFAHWPLFCKLLEKATVVELD